MTERLKIHDCAFRKAKSTSRDDSPAFMTIYDGHDDITTGVTTWGLMDIDDIQEENEPTCPAAQVCPRPVKEGLGGDEEGVWWLTRESRRHRSRYENVDKWPCHKVRPSVVLRRLRKILSARDEIE